MVGNFRLVGNAKVILGRSSASCRGPKPASGHVPQPNLTNNVMYQKQTSGPEQFPVVGRLSVTGDVTGSSLQVDSIADARHRSRLRSQPIGCTQPDATDRPWAIACSSRVSRSSVLRLSLIHISEPTR